MMAEDPEQRYTEVERKAMQAAREGRKVSGAVKNFNGAKVFTLDELAGDASPPPTPIKEEAPQPEVVSKQDIETVKRLKDLAYGPAEEENSEQENANSITGETSPGFCPNCNWDLSKLKEYHATDDDKVEYCRAILGERRFVKRVPFLGGRIVITYRSPTVDEERLIVETTAKAVQAGKVYGEQDWALMFRKYQLICMLSAISGEDKDTSYEEVLPIPEAYKEYEGDYYLEKVYRKVTSGWNTMLHAMALRGCIQVTDILSELAAKVDDQNFWQGLPESGI